MRTCTALLSALLLAGPAGAQDAGAPAPAAAAAPVVVGVYTPRVFFADSLARNRYADQLAKSLEQAAGRPVQGRAFSSGGEFQKQVRGGRIDFAVVDAQYAAELGGARPLAQGTHGGSPTRPMVMVVGEKIDAATIGDMKGKTLATVAVGGKDPQFTHGFLLQRQVEAGYFRKTRPSRSVQGALSQVKQGRASAAFTYQGSTAGLKVIFTSRPVPLPVFVQVKPELDAAVVSAVSGAIRGVKVASPAFDGFTGYDAGAHAGLKSALGAGLTAPGASTVFAPAATLPPPVPEHLDPGQRAPVELPPVVEGMALPEPAGDAF